MLNIIKKSGKDKKETFEVFLNGENLPVGEISEGLSVLESKGGFNIATYKLGFSEKIKKLTVEKLNQVNQLSLLWKSSNDFRLYIDIQILNIENSSTFGRQVKAALKFGIYPNLNNWKRRYSFKEYQKEFLKNLKNEKKIVFNFKPEQNHLNVDLSTNHIFSDLSLLNELKKYEDSIFECLKYTETILENEFVQNSIQSTFDFPADIKTSCEQYLLYFATFLKDLGINANSNLKEEAGKALFSVTPTDDIEALDKIREALAVYLNLPASPIVYDESFAAMRLQQQIENLQHSQRMAVRELQFNEKLLIAQSDTLHEKNITISQQQSVIEQQNKIIEKISSKSIMMDSVENKEELEEIYDGIKVGESESLKKWLGISFNPAKAIKTAVKNTLGKDGGKKSVLGLDEEV